MQLCCDGDWSAKCVLCPFVLPLEKNSVYPMAAILDSRVKLMSYCQTDVRIGILEVDLPLKVVLDMILGALVQKLNFQDGTGGHLGFLVQIDVVSPNICQNRNPRG